MLLYTETGEFETEKFRLWSTIYPQMDQEGRKVV